MNDKTAEGRRSDKGVSNRWNRVRYRAYEPVYDFLAKPLEAGRRRAIERLEVESGDRVLILGSGTGADLKYLPEGCEVTAIDLTPAMVRRTRRRADDLGFEADVQVGDAQNLPFEKDSFDAVILHLVLSVVPDPGSVVAETERVVTQDGRVSIYDKFIPEDETPSFLRRLVNPVARFLFADLNNRLEPMVQDTCLTPEEYDRFLGGMYTVTIAHPTVKG